MIREINEQAGQDFFLSGKSIPKSLNEEIPIIARNAIKKTNVRGLAVQLLQEKKKLIRYQIIPTEIKIFTRYASTFHNGGEPDSDIKVPEDILSPVVLYSLEQSPYPSVSRKRVQGDAFKKKIPSCVIMAEKENLFWI
jgi:hypothetical protein